MYLHFRGTVSFFICLY